MGRGVIEVCGNIHVNTGACQSAIACIAISWTEELNNAYYERSIVGECE